MSLYAQMQLDSATPSNWDIALYSDLYGIYNCAKINHEISQVVANRYNKAVAN